MAAYQSNAVTRPFAQAGVAIAAAPAAPPGTFLPGTKVQVGNHRVVIDKYLSEGGFAHVYVVTLPKPVDGKEKAVLKRVAVPDKDHLASMRNEVETMKRLRGHKYIVKYFDSHASPLKAGGYEVFLLMEWCNGGGLIDFMNTRLQNRLTEPEIVKILTDIADGVACMHYLSPPLLHRDLKVENVLITTDGKTKTFKLCDFGSAAVARPAATTAAEGRLIEDDVQRHTTLQYRSPEMIDVYRKQPIDEKSDIWALGCFLYKLCYYTTPFEEVGQMAILNATFKYPGYPRFSDELKLLIASMLQENPARRPNIYQVLAKASKMDGRPLSIRDNYTNRSRSEDTRTSKPSDSSTTKSPAPSTASGATFAPPKQDTAHLIPQVEPMRRGRPVAPMSHHNSAKPSPSPLRMVDHSDAFASFDGGAAADELSSKFPRLEEFSLMSDKSSNFSFSSKPDNSTAKVDADLASRVTQALADDAFARPASPPKPKPKPLASNMVNTSRQSNDLGRKRSMEDRDTRASSEMTATQLSKSNMISTGTGSSPPLHPSTKVTASDRPVWRVPETADPVTRAASISQPPSRAKPIVSRDKANSRLASLLQQDAARSQLASETEPKSPISSRPSLEGGRPLLRDIDTGLHRSRSLNMRNRPVSINMGTSPTHINDRERKVSSEVKISDFEAELPALTHAVSETSNTNIRSDIEYLRAREEEEKEKHKHLKRLSGGNRHQKRSSLPSAAIAGTKNLLQGRFGEAFRKFESHGSDTQHGQEAPQSPTEDERSLLTPIAGSEATDLSDDRRGLDETEELSPELRRELEKQKLEAEERRVERAAAEYKQRMGVKGNGPPPISAKAVSIQNRVQSLLAENDKPASKTATGYGRFTSETQQSVPDLSYSQPEKNPISNPGSAIDLPAQSKSQRPIAPPKPRVLRTGTIETTSTSKTEEFIPSDEWEESFSKKYPDLSHLEVMETSIDSKSRPPLRMKEI